MAGQDGAAQAAIPGGDNVKVEFEDGIAWVKLNRPEKRNAMSVALAAEMDESARCARNSTTAAACWC